jgi:hypothetical protein
MPIEENLGLSRQKRWKSLFIIFEGKDKKCFSATFRFVNVTYKAKRILHKKKLA